MNLSFYKTAFKVTAVGNIIAALAAIAGMREHIELFYGTSEADTTLFHFYHTNLWIFVLVFGIGYWFLGADPIRNRIVALLGAIGKLFIASSWIHMLSMGKAKPIIIAGIIYDLFFGLLMAWFFWKTRGSREEMGH